MVWDYMTFMWRHGNDTYNLLRLLMAYMTVLDGAVNMKNIQIVLFMVDGIQYIPWVVIFLRMRNGIMYHER